MMTKLFLSAALAALPSPPPFGDDARASTLAGHALRAFTQLNFPASRALSNSAHRYYQRAVDCQRAC